MDRKRSKRNGEDYIQDKQFICSKNLWRMHGRGPSKLILHVQ